MAQHDLSIIIKAALQDSQQQITDLNKNIADIAKKLDVIKLKINIDDSQLKNITAHLHSVGTEAQKTQTKIQKTFKDTKLSGEGYKDLQDRINEIKNSTDQYAKATIQTYKNTKNLKSATIEYRNELGQLVKEQLKWTQFYDKQNNTTKKVFQTVGFTFIDDKAKKQKVLDEAEKFVNAYNTKFNNLNRGINSQGVTLPAHLSKQFIDLQKEINKINVNTPKTELERLKNTYESLTNQANIFIKQQKDATKDSRGFNFQQYPKMTNAVSNVTNAQLYYNQSLVAGKKLLDANVAETEKYIKVTQRLREGSEISTVTAYINKATGETHKFSESMKDLYTRTWDFGSALKTAAEKFSIWLIMGNTIMGIQHGIEALLDTIVSVDKQLVELTKVMDGVDVNFVTEESIQMANQYGRSLSETLDAMTEIAKAGYLLEESLQMTNAALLGANVMGLSLKDTADVLIGAVTAFNLHASDAIMLVDKWNLVDNKFAVSSAGLSSAMKKSAETAQQFGKLDAA